MLGFKWKIWMLVCCVSVLKKVISWGVMVLIVNIIICWGNWFGVVLWFSVFKVSWCNWVGCKGLDWVSWCYILFC